MENLETEQSKEILQIILKALLELDNPKEQIKMLHYIKHYLINNHHNKIKELKELQDKHIECINILNKEI